jgi:hypothetical protein
MMLSAALDKPFLGKYNVNKDTKWAYYSLEDGDKTTYRRQKSICNGLEVKNPNLDTIHIYTEDDVESGNKIFNIDNLSGEIDYLIAKKYNVVVIDTLRRIMVGDENSSATTNDIIHNFVVPLKNKGITVIILHHLKKGIFNDYEDAEEWGDKIRGSGDIRAGFDIIYGFARLKDFMTTDGISTRNTFLITVKHKNVEVTNKMCIDISLNKTDPLNEVSIFKYTGDTIKVKTLKQNHKDQILQLLKMGSLQRKEIVSSIKGCSEITIIRYLDELKASGEFEIVEFGRYSIPKEGNPQ